MTTDRTTQSTELTRIEEWVARNAPSPTASVMPDVLAVLQSHQSQLDLLLGMLEKLTPAAQETTCAKCGWKNPTEFCGSGDCPYPRLSPPATPQPATCGHPSMARWNMSDAVTGGVHQWCENCGAIKFATPQGAEPMWKVPQNLPQPPAPQQTEG